MYKKRKMTQKATFTLIFLLLFGVFSINAQTREDIKIYIPMPVGGNSEQQLYFYENFAMETQAAGYALTENSSEADYSLNLRIGPNVILYDDGFEEPAPPEEPQYTLSVTLSHIGEEIDLVQFDFSFTELPEMYEFNLFLLYQAMANVPLTKLGPIPQESDRWRNKWLYVRLSADFNVPAFLPYPNVYHISDSDTGHRSNFPVPYLVPFGPGATVGLELQFLNWMSTEVDIAFILGNLNSDTEIIGHKYDIVGTLDASLKFPIKPTRHYMIEPFIGIAIPMAFLGATVPRFGIQGGVQVAAKAGEMGGFFANMRGEYDFAQMTTKAPEKTDITEIKWTRFVIGVGFGYKLGFMNRKQDQD